MEAVSMNLCPSTPSPPDNASYATLSPLAVPGLCSAMRRGEDHGVEMGFFSMLISSCRCEQVLQEHRRNDWLQALHLVEDLLGLLYTSCLPGKIWGILCAGVSLEKPLDGV